MMWIFEPPAAEQVFEDFVRESKLTVYRDEWLDRAVDRVTRNGVPYVERVFSTMDYGQTAV